MGAKGGKLCGLIIGFVSLVQHCEANSNTNANAMQRRRGSRLPCDPSTLLRIQLNRPSGSEVGLTYFWFKDRCGPVVVFGEIVR